MEENTSQSSDELLDGTTNPIDGRPDGIYRYPNVDALYKKENGMWYKKIGESDYVPLQTGDVNARVKLLESNAVPVPSNDPVEINRYTNKQDIDVLQPVKTYDEIFKIKSQELFQSSQSPLTKPKKVEPVKKADKYKIVNNNGVDSWQERKDVKIDQTFDPKTGEPIGMSEIAVYQDVTDPLKVEKLNNEYKSNASTSNQQQIFTGYPGKSGTEYLISPDNLWQVKRPGSSEFFTITDPNSVKALNSHFKQNAEVFDDKKAVEIKQKNEYINNLNTRINKINKDLVGNNYGEKYVISKLMMLFPEFKFETSGVFTDNIKVSKIKDGVRVSSIEVPLDNFFDEGDINSANRLKEWIRVNSLSNIDESLLSYQQANAKLENKIYDLVYDRDKELSKVVSDATSIDKTITNDKAFQQLYRMSPVLFPEETKKIQEAEELLTKDYAKTVKETYARVRGKSEEEQAAAFMAIKPNSAVINAANNYSNSVKDNYNEFISQQKRFNEYINDIDLKVKSGEISREEYENVYKQKIKESAESLKADGEKIKEEFSALNYYIKGSDKAIASDLFIKEMTGTTIGGLGRSVVDGALSIPTYLLGLNKKQRKEFIDNIAGVGTTDEYMQSENRLDITKAAFQMARSLSANITGRLIEGPIGGFVSLYAMSYNEMKDSLDEVKGISNEDKVLMSSIYGIVGGALENVGLGYLLTKSAAKRGASSWILKNVFSQLPKNASKEMIEAQIMNSTKLYASRAAITFAGSSAVEGVVEASQAGAQRLIQEAYDQMREKEYFNNESAWEIAGDMAYEGYMGMLGGGIVEGAMQSSEILSRGVNVLKTKDQINLLIQSANLDGIDHALLTKLKASIITGKLSKDDAKKVLESFKEVKAKINSMPEDMSIDNKSVALDLMIERDNLNKKIEGKDPFLVVMEKERIGQINEQLKNLGNAVQEPSTEGVLQREQEGVTETGGERGGVEPIVQGEEVTREGEAKAETKAEEVTLDKEAIQKNSLTEVERVKSLTNDVEDGATFNLDGTKYEGKGLIVPVVSKNTTAEEVTPEMISDFVEEHKDKIGDNETVKVGIYKFPNSNKVSIDLNILAPESSREQAIEFGKNADQESLFDLGTFENVKTGGTGVNPMQFTNDQFKEISKAFAEGRVPNVFGKETTIQEVTITPETNQTVTERINKETDTKRKKVFTAVQKVLSAIPNSRIILHDNVDAFVSGVAKSAGITNDEAISQGVNNNRGSYVNGDIHINLETAGVTTVFHEAFHDLLAKKGMDNNALLDMAKGLKSVISDKALKQRLDDFVSNYEQGERAEEYTTELGAIMAEAQKELSTTKFQQFKTLVNKIAKKLGMPVVFSAAATAQDAVDFMNSMAGKLGKGEQIEVGEAKGKTGIKSQTEKLFLGETPKFKSLDDVSKYIQSWVDENKLFDKSIEQVSDQEVVDKFAEHILSEIKAWESIKGSEYVGFYDEDIPQRLNPELQKFAKERYGRELTDEEVSLYHIVSAFASPSADPQFDSSKGLEVFDKYMMTGELTAYGTEQATIWDTDSKGKRYDTGKLKFDENGNPVYKQVAKAYATTSLEKFNNIVNHFKGDVSKAVKWVLSNHSFEEASKMMNKPTTGPKANQLDENEYFTKENGGTGVFAITGAKLGSYILNRVGNYSTVTKDMWYARTLARLAGESLTEKGKAIKSPWASNTKEGLRKRKLADKAFQIVAKELGTSPADVQQKIWDFEKRLYGKLGAVEKASYASEGFKSKAKEILSQQPPSNAKKIKAQRTAPGNKLFNEPLKDAETIAKSYMNSVGMDYVPVEKITKLDENLSKRISDAYDKMKNDPNDPKVKAAYEAMAKETLDQHKAIIDKGYKVEINNTEPYSDSGAMIEDLRDNKRMKIFSTESGFGDEPITDEQRKENPLLRDSGFKDVNGETLLVNDVFRFVHDFFGHAKLGNSFGPIGEENAWRVHSEMYSPEARKAMTSETRGQNSWVNFSGVNDAVFKKRDKARQLRKEGKIEEANQMVGEVYEEMSFADQKVGLLPDFAFEEGRPSKIKAQKQSKEDAIQDAKDIHEKSFKRFKDAKKAIANAVNNLEKSKWYRDADDIQREEAVREIRKFFGEKLKAAPSVAKITGKTKQTAFVSDLAAAIRDQVRLQARSSRETAKNINDRRKALGVAIKQVVSQYKGKITERQLNAINRKIANVNLFNQEMVDRVIDYVNKVMNNAEYTTKVNNAFAERRAIRRMMKSGNMAETVAVAKEFTQIDPSMVDDIDAYLEMAQKIRGAVKSSRRVKDEVSLKQIVNFGEAYEYIKPVLEAQEESMKNMLLAEYNDLAEAGVISKDMTLKDINKILNKIRLDEKVESNEEESAREFLKQRLETIKSIISMVVNGYNPLNGEVMEISDRNKQMIQKIIKSDMNNMSTKQLIEMVDSLSNFVENGAVGGIEAAYSTYIGEENAASLEKKGVVARPLKMYFNKKIGRILGNGFTSLNELFNRMFVGVNQGINVMTKSGFADVILGANKARRQVKDIQDAYVKKFGKIKNFFQIENVYERGAIAFLKRNLIGSDIEVKSEFNRRVDWLFESAERLKNGTQKEQKMAEVYSKVFDKLDVKSRNLNKIISQANPTNVAAVDWWINEWSTHYSDLSDVSKSVYNTILGKDINYTPDRLKTTSEGSSQTINDKILESKSAFLMNTDAITDTNESGVMIASVRPKIEKTKGRYVSLDFDVNNIESLTGALVDINTAGAIRQVDSFLKSKSFKSIVTSVDDREILVERVNKYIRRAKNKLSVPNDVFRDIDNALNTISSIGTALGLGGILQSVKQTVSVAASTAIQTGTSFKIYGGSDFNNWLNTTGASVSNRGQESLTAIESANKKIQSFNGTFDKAVSKFKDLTQWQLRLFLSRPDVFVARSAFKSYYEQFLKRNGYDVSKIDWANWNDTIKKEGIEDLNKEAIIYADTMVSRQQNVSDERLAGELLANEDSARKLIRKVLLPFASFSINQRARLVADINKLYVGNNSMSPEDRAIAIKSIAGTLAEQGIFQLINFGIGMAIYYVAKSITGHEDDEEEWEKRMRNATKYPLKSLLADMTSPNPLADDAVVFGADQLLAMFGSPSDSEINQAIKDEEELRLSTGKKPMTESQIEAFKNKYIEDNTYQLSYNFSNAEEGKYGMFSIGYDQYIKLAENSELANKGTFTDDYMGKETTKYLTDKDKSLAMWIFYGLDVPYSTGMALKEMGQVANKTYSIIKKRALTESQYETYKEFKKEFKREPQDWEIKMIKTGKNTGKIFGAINYVQDKGGLSNKQGIEYSNIFDKTGNIPTDAIFRLIEQNKNSKYILNKMSEERKKAKKSDVVFD